MRFITSYERDCKDLFSRLPDDHLGNHIAGLFDADGCFNISMQNNRFHARFFLQQHGRDAPLHENISEFLDCGRVYSLNDRRLSRYVVYKRKDLLDKLFPFFKKYQIFTTKRVDLELFIQAVQYLEDKKSNHVQDPRQVLEYAAKMSMNKFWSRKQRFNNILQENNINIEDLRKNYLQQDHQEFLQNNPMTPAYISGFIDGEGSFVIYLEHRPTKWPLINAFPLFELSQHERSAHVLYEIQKILGGGNLYNSKNQVIKWRIEKVQQLESSIFSFLEEYPLLSKKRYDFQIMKDIVRMKQKKMHKSQQGAKCIIEKSYEMNQYQGSKSRRKYSKEQMLTWLDQAKTQSEFALKRKDLYELKNLVLPK